MPGAARDSAGEEHRGRRKPANSLPQSHPPKPSLRHDNQIGEPDPVLESVLVFIRGERHDQRSDRRPVKIFTSLSLFPFSWEYLLSSSVAAAILKKSVRRRKRVRTAARSRCPWSRARFDGAATGARRS